MASALQLCSLAGQLQGRLCVQAPVQLALFLASNATALTAAPSCHACVQLSQVRAGACKSGPPPLLPAVLPSPSCAPRPAQAFAINVMASVLMLAHFEARARALFLLRQPLLDAAAAAVEG